MAHGSSLAGAESLLPRVGMVSDLALDSWDRGSVSQHVSIEDLLDLEMTFDASAGEFSQPTTGQRRKLRHPT
jgi:hypothetical protein